MCAAIALLASPQQPTLINGGSADNHQRLLAALREHPEIHIAALHVGISPAGARKLLEIYGRPGELHSYACETVRCDKCGRLVNRWPCLACAHREIASSKLESR